MKIAIVNLTKGGMSGGYQKYLANMLPRMAKNPLVDKILCAAPPSLMIERWLDKPQNVFFIDCKAISYFHFLHNKSLKHALNSFVPDVIYLPLERYFRYNGIPVVNMVRNMEPMISLPERNPISEMIKNWLRAYSARKAVAKADNVIAVSDFVKSFLVERWRIPEEKVTRIYHGHEMQYKENYHKPNKIPDNWNGNFLFTAGSIRPSRGLWDILKALPAIISYNMTIKGLVVAGDCSPNMVSLRNNMLKWGVDNNLSASICWAGSLNETEMAWCYQNCKMFVMTSRVESFGQIALEAMSHGCICISADNPCLPELFGDAAIYYPPEDGKALSDAIKTIFTWDDNQRKVMSEKARKRAGEFSWDICAERTVAQFAKVIRQ